jgi:Zn-dependent protease with chaperone function
MQIVNRQPGNTADISSARGTAQRELWQLIGLSVVVLIGAWFIIGMAVDFVVSRISYETEAKIFRHFQFPTPGEEDDPGNNDLEKAGIILAQLQNDPKVPPLPYRLVLIANDTPNAFAFPGGTIGVTRGLLDALDEDIELAFVLAHELGHFYNRDHLQGVGRAIGFRVIMAVLFSGGTGAESFGSMIDFVFQRGYSQEREKKADQFGVERVFAAYGKTEGVDRLFRILHDEQRLPRWAYMFSTHPSPEHRIDDLQSYAADLKM